jgi:hypothetical protein
VGRFASVNIDGDPLILNTSWPPINSRWNQDLPQPIGTGFMQRITLYILVGMLAGQVSAQEHATFEFGNHPTASSSMTQLFQQHYREPTVKGAATLWDMWLAGASLWYAGQTPAEGEAMRSYWRGRLLTRPIDAEGYVGTCQHLGSAHADGWPFPLWTQSEGVGFHFTLAHNPFLAAMNTPRASSAEGWILEGCSVSQLNEAEGMVLTLDRPNASITTPAFDIDPYVSPFVCVDLATDGLPSTDSPEIRWRRDEAFRPEDRLAFTPPRAGEGGKLVMIPLYRHPGHQGRIKQWRIDWNNQGPGKVVLRAWHSAVDSRHNVNNPSFVLGCLDYARWTADLPFLREALPKIWTALDYALEEFHVREEGIVRTDWVGHDGRTGLDRTTSPKRLIRGRGIGSNYWDLLPFGSRDLMATLYVLAAVDRTALLHRQLERHPEWGLPIPPARLQAEKLEALAKFIRQAARALFWNDTTGRFAACVDADRFLHDYGYSYLNMEAIYYGLANPSQARTIFDWLDGRRTVPGDTSQGSDIYHFRFASRASTKRNIDWYMFAWADPESIAWGGQVQDGGAVLAWSYHDVMSRLQTLGPQNAWERIDQIARWYAEVQSEGGYRAYYAKPGRGSLQGCGTPGGLGLDCEFSESLLVPLSIVEGFAGLDATVEGLRISPHLPTDLPTLKIQSIAIHGHIIHVEMTGQRVTLQSVASSGRPLRLFLADPSYRRDGTPAPSEGFVWQPADAPTIEWTKDTAAQANLDPAPRRVDPSLSPRRPGSFRIRPITNDLANKISGTVSIDP